jgi:hypothetical protein
MSILNTPSPTLPALARTEGAGELWCIGLRSTYSLFISPARSSSEIVQTQDVVGGQIKTIITARC